MLHTSSSRSPRLSSLLLGFSLLSLLLILAFPQASNAATITVTSGTDAGGTCPGANCTLRQAIATAADFDTITFDPAITTINLTSGELYIDKSLTITGPGANLLTVQRSAAGGTPDFRVFSINALYPTISGMTISNGHAYAASGLGAYGGGIFFTSNSNSVFVILGCAFTGNSASFAGGGISNIGGRVYVSTSTISGNSVNSSGSALGGGGGGGAYNSGELSFDASTISGNSATPASLDTFRGGGIYNLGTLEIAFSTIAFNSSYLGGGIFGVVGGTNSIAAAVTIIAKNTDVYGSPDLSGNLASSGYNLIGNTGGTTITGTTTGNQLNVDPLLGALQDNGGSTYTHALLAGSPALDGGATGPAVDQRGFTRPIDLPSYPNAAGGDGGDIGAFEAQGAPTPIPSPSPTPTFTSTNTPSATPTPAPACISNMISWWPGEGNALDVVSSNNGTLQNGTGFASGEVGQSFSFDGSDDAVFVGNPPSLNVTSTTIEAWIKTNNFPDGTISSVLTKWGFDGSVDSYLLGLINSGGVISVFGAIGDGSTGDPGITGGTVATNTWTHIAMTYDSASGSNRLYLNGAEVASRTRTGGIYPTVTNVYIGREDSPQGRFFNGLIDEPSIYSRVLSAAEIQAIYNAGSAGKCSSSQTPTSTPTATSTPTTTPTNTPTPSDYADTTMQLGANTTITPLATPANTVRLTVSTSTSFKGKLEGSPTTGVVRVTDAHPAGVYPVTVTRFDGAGGTTTATFTLTVTTPALCSQATFAAATNFTVGGNPTSVAVGDFNGDGNQDLAIANFGGYVSILLGNGAGGFGAATTFSVGAATVWVAVGDFNGDGNQDLVTANNSSSNVSVLLGNGGGSFSSATNFPIGTAPSSVAVGDFNGDGKQDLVTSNSASTTVSVLLGTGTGSFSAVTNFPAGNNPPSVVVGDFNGDGKQDLAVNEASFYALVLLGDGMGSFGAPTIFSGGTSYSLAIGDFNGDGKQDLASTTSGPVAVLLGNGAGSFSNAPGSPFTVGSFPFSVAVGDLDNDGNQDIATANRNGNTVAVLSGIGTGGFAAATYFASGSSPNSVAVGDLNGDTNLDLVVANSASNNLSILMRQCAGPTNTPTSTPTNTPTATATQTATPGGASISGTITYGNAIGNPVPPRFVKNVSLSSTVGSPPVGPVITGTPGTYTLTGFGAGSYTIKPTKPGGPNGAITSNDAARVAQGVSGALNFVSQNQRFAADVTGNGAISSQDAAKIAQFVAGLPFSPPNLTGEWRFFTSNLPAFPAGAHPQDRTYASVTSSVTGEDYVGLLVGEASGNWNPASHPRPAGIVESGKWKVESENGGPERGIEVKLPQAAVSTDKEIVVPVNVQGIADKEVISYEFDLRYDPTVIQPMENPIYVAGTVSRGLSVVVNPYEPGLLRVVVYGALPIDENGVLLNLRFTAVGAVGSVSPLTWERVMFNEGEPRVSVANGQLELF